MSRYKHFCAKGFTINWTPEIFTEKRVVQTDSVTYHLQDGRNEKISDGFYNEEVAKVKYPLYLIEKVIRKKGKMALVKWMGFDSSKNQWVPIDSIV